MIVATAERSEKAGRAVVARWLIAGIWLVYLFANPVTELVRHADGWRRYVGLAAMATFIVIYFTVVGRAGWLRQPPDNRGELLRRWVRLLGLVGCVAAVAPGAGARALTCMVFIAAAAMGTLPLLQAWMWVGALFAATELLGRAVPGWSDGGNGFAVILAGLAVWAFRTAVWRRQQLVQAERELAELALREERSRIARDLHDILGHSLTVVAVKTELAARLVDIDLPRARRELDDLQRLTRDALADVRATALGVRGVSLPGEIASARTALESAGITADLPTAADEVPTRWRELFAWTIREGVTNVVRHSNARRCTVTLDPRRVSVIDDGRGPGHEPSAGSGLEGLRHRAQLAGATLATGPGPGGVGFSITVEVPA